MMPELIVEGPADHVRLLRLNRPEKRNALATPLLEAISQALAQADMDEAIRVVVLTGNERVFAAGADLAEIAEATGKDEVEGVRFRAWGRIGAFSKPLIAAVEGWCLGAGLELIMRADLIVAGDGARFGQPETNLGIIPGAGGTAILPRLVGQSLAMYMVLTGEPISAESARTAGLITSVVPDRQALGEALSLASRLATRAPRALRTAKASILGIRNLSLDDHLLSERKAFVSLLDGAEKAEGVTAFLERRSPVWPTR